MNEAKSHQHGADGVGREELARALRPSVNSMLALAKLLADNEDNNLSAKQIDYAQTIYSAGTHLLGLLDGLLAHEGLAGEAADAPIAMPDPATASDFAARPYRGRRSRRYDDGVVLIAERDAAIAAALADRVRQGGFEPEVAGHLAGAHALLAERKPDAIIIGTGVEDIDAEGMLATLRELPHARNLPSQRVFPDRNLEEALAQTGRFLRQALGTPLRKRRRMLPHRRHGPLDLAGRRVVLIDADIRNLYAITGALEQQGMLVLQAETGAEGLAALERNPDADAVVIDVASAACDGRDAIRALRRDARFESLPIIALTPGGDGCREELAATGVSDSLDKPCGAERLISLLRTRLLAPR